MQRFISISLILFCLYFLGGCTAAVVGGAVAGTSIAMDKRTTGDYVEDQNIKSKFTHLYYQNDALTEQTHVNVTSYNRQVLITGEAPTDELKQQLSIIAGQIKNVRKHFNEVVVAEPTSMSVRTNDSYITSKIKTSIFTHISELDGAQVKVVTENGSVFLMGLVNREQAKQITEIARTTNGVKRVIKLFEYPNPRDTRI
ncbi:BON domain-containing protein [sulfur-oxidizing endosymbiont of Gigantopelta aegis]|uniref:BON domain-containing protein n=1 Tax=sulfur-oxidizing endosymbiont of Gigantopelta aegis TaxID=2794934 RepID=UPI0018DC20C4|nr:BON domain-containing protein [sulfur-oxidizing endosymbiont of Gigantopelta aegis]